MIGGWIGGWIARSARWIGGPRLRLGDALLGLRLGSGVSKSNSGAVSLRGHDRSEPEVHLLGAQDAQGQL